jgi:hypothetical protein
VDLQRARFIVSDRAGDALSNLPAGVASLNVNQLASRLREQFPPAEAAALAEQVTLRKKALDRFGEDLGFLFTPEGLEMMTHPVVARRRAERLATMSTAVVDLTCGLGGDLAACTSRSLPCTGMDRDRVTAMLGAVNVPAASIVQAAAERHPFDLSSATIILDPSRRTAAGRRFDPAAFSPPWDVAMQLLRDARSGVLKAPPGIEHRHIPPDMEVEFVQLGRSMREAAVWAGRAATAGLSRAVLLPGPVILDSLAPQAAPTPVPVGAFVFDPESCVTRAGLVRHLAHRLGALMLDPQVAYLTSETPAFDPLCATFEVLDVVPFSASRLKARLREKSWSPREVRRRAFPVEPDELLKLLGPLAGEPVTLLCTTLAARRTIIVGRRRKEIAQDDRQ